MSEEKVEAASSAIDSGLIMFGATAVAYLCAYLFERGYLGYFGVPPELIEVGIMSLVSTGGAFLIFSIIVLQLFGVFMQMGDVVEFGKLKGFTKLFLKWWIFFLIWTLSLFFFEQTWMSLSVFYVWSFVFILDLVVPLIPDGKESSYDQRLYDYLQSRVSEAKREGTILKSKIAKRFAGIFIILGITAFACIFSGQLAAATRTGFAVIDSFNGYLVLRHYGDRYLLIKYDFDANRFGREFMIVDGADGVGKMHVVNISSHP